MKYLLIKIIFFKKNAGMTLIELILYVAILSILIFGFIRAIYGVSDTDMNTAKNIHEAYKKMTNFKFGKVSQKDKSHGFIALVAILLLVLAVCAVSVTIVGSAYFYSDSVLRHELRIQSRLNVESCLNYVESMLSRDFNLRGDFFVKEFGCEVNIEENFPSNLSVRVNAKSDGKSGTTLNVSAYGNETLLVSDTFIKRLFRSI